MVYQPKISLADGGLSRVEALVRWDDPELGPVEPSRFVPLAEDHGLIDDLTHWGLRTILRQWLDWRNAGLDTCIAFNISALSLQHLDFPDLVERMCRALEVPTGPAGARTDRGGDAAAGQADGHADALPDQGHRRTRSACAL